MSWGRGLAPSGLTSSPSLLPAHPPGQLLLLPRGSSAETVWVATGPWMWCGHISCLSMGTRGPGRQGRADGSQGTGSGDQLSLPSPLLAAPRTRSWATFHCSQTGPPLLLSPPATPATSSCRKAEFFLASPPRTPPYPRKEASKLGKERDICGQGNSREKTGAAWPSATALFPKHLQCHGTHHFPPGGESLSLPPQDPTDAQECRLRAGHLWQGSWTDGMISGAWLGLKSRNAV